MSEIISMNNKHNKSMGESQLIKKSEEMLMDARNNTLPANISMSVPIAKLSTLGAGISSIIPALNTVTQTTTMDMQGLYRVANSGAGDVLKIAKDGNVWGAMKTAEGTSKMAKFQVADPLSATTKTVMGANPATMMMAVALFSIEQELGKIEEIEKQIISFLEIEKESEIEADVVTLNDIIKKFKHSWNNEHFIASNHKMVCDIQRTARKNIISYQKLVSESMNERKLIVAGTQVNSILKGLYKKFKYYRLSLYTFSLASLLEIMLSGNYKEESISSVIEDVERYSSEYRDLFTNCSSFLETLSQKSIEMNVMKGLGTASNALGKLIGNLPKVKDGQLEDILQEKGEKIKNNAVEVSQELIGSFAEVSNPNTGIFISKMRDMVSIYNKTTEICFDKENIYLIA